MKLKPLKLTGKCECCKRRRRKGRWFDSIDVFICKRCIDFADAFWERNQLLYKEAFGEDFKTNGHA